MKCKICHTNETDNTSGICWECMNKYYNEIQKDPLNCPFLNTATGVLMNSKEAIEIIKNLKKIIKRDNK
ncbi:MAG: hypothetical protein PHO28_03995 [Candidatus Pacebacteria bacterium]|nr:hypothetical protein [Candidatus Paceibacterota bacterium]